MTNITETSTWEEDVFQIDTTTPVLGGQVAFNNEGDPVEGHSNAQAQQLANRTRWLKDQIETVSTVNSKLTARRVNAADYGVDPTGVASSSAGMTAAWAKLRETVDTVTRANPVIFEIPPGVYLIDQTVDWTRIFSWNLKIDARGAVFLCRTTNDIAVDMTGTRGIEGELPFLYGDNNFRPKAGLLLGPGELDTCGNNKFINLKTDGHFDLTPVWNIGSETTVWDFCYFQNRATGADKYAYIGDSMNRFGASSKFTKTRAAMTWASLTCNTFRSTRAANYGGGPSTYIEGVFNWSWDIGCYHLTFGDAGIVIRCSAATTYRNTNLKIEGLFETFAGGTYGGMKDCVRIVTEAGLQTDIRGFYLNAGQPQAKRSIVRLELVDGTEVTNSSTTRVKLAIADIQVARTINLTTVTPVFSGAGLSVQGRINVRESAMVNLSVLEGFQGELLTADYGLVTKPPYNTAQAFSFVVFDEITGNIVRVSRGESSLSLAPADVPKIEVFSSQPDVNLRLVPKGAGRVEAPATDFSAPVLLPGYTKATLPSAATFTRSLIVVVDATRGTGSGPAICRSNGTNWIDLNTNAAVV